MRMLRAQICPIFQHKQYITPSHNELSIVQWAMMGLLKLDGVGPVDNRPSTDSLHHFVFRTALASPGLLNMTLSQETDLERIHIKIPHTGNTWPFCTSVIKEYRYYTISLSKYHVWYQYHKSMSIGSKKGQERSRTVNTVKNCQYGPKRTKMAKKR